MWTLMLHTTMFTFLFALRRCSDMFIEINYSNSKKILNISNKFTQPELYNGLQYFITASEFKSFPSLTH